MTGKLKIPSKQDVLDNPSLLPSLLDQHYEELKRHSLFDDENILAIRLYDKAANTVAHWLAREDNEYLLTKYVDNYKVLRLENLNLFTIAHHFALHADERWLNSKAARDVDILTLVSKNMGSVAYQMTKNKACLDNHAMFDKRVLTHKDFGEQIVHHLHDNHPDDERTSVEHMIYVLISQAAAYKHNSPLSVSLGPKIIQTTHDLISQSSNPELNIKYCLAAFSTAHHCSNFPSFLNDSFHRKWALIREEIVDITANLLSKHPEMINKLNKPDIFCEPGQDMLHHLYSRLTLELSTRNAEMIENSDQDETSVLKLY
jgi:hypothetical protein